jgi:hypothetical protein
MTKAMYNTLIKPLLDKLVALMILIILAPVFFRIRKAKGETRLLSMLKMNNPNFK